MDAAKRIVTMAGLCVGNALTLVATEVWFRALTVTDGKIQMDVNAAGEGWIELGVFALGWALTVLAMGAVLFADGSEEAEPPWATVEEI